MRILVLSAFPFLDYQAYRQEFLRHLGRHLPDVNDVALVYSHATLSAHFAEAKRLSGNINVRQKLIRKVSGEKAGTIKAKERLEKLAAKLEIPVRKFSRLGDTTCLRFIREFRPDVIFSLAGVYIPNEVLTLPHIGVVGAHYALLPDIRGGDTIRWTIFLNKPLYVSHMLLASKIDMGDILLRVPVTVEPGDGISDLRAKCQDLNGKGHMDVLDHLLAGTLRAEPQQENQGHTFYRMGQYLQNKVDRMLSERRYNHYRKTA
jgi:methionyl-tRNA formyltransferase